MNHLMGNVFKRSLLQLLDNLFTRSFFTDIESDIEWVT